MNNIRVRFAPSPTGFLHIGSLRQVLFNYLIAKSLNGKIILRVEDTDKKREVPGALEALYDILNWLGFEFDESPLKGGDYGPYIQSERFSIYKKYADELIEKGEAYYCFCSAERLEKMRTEQQERKEPPRYDRACRNLSTDEIEKRLKAGEPYVIRQKMPLSGEVIVKDELRGEIRFNMEDIEDQVLLKSDGIPTYQLASVIDDHLMEISHVLRGEEWIPSFPKNILLYKAFGWEAPKFVHLALSLDKAGGKLSKRKGDVSVEQYKEKGYLPEALINFSALSGWRPKGSDQEIFSNSELIDQFRIEDMRVSGAVFDLDKLDYLNEYYIRQKSVNELAKLCLPYLVKIENALKVENDDSKYKICDNEFTFSYIKEIVALEQERMKKLSDITDATEFFFLNELEYDPKLLIWKKLTGAEVKKNLKEVYEQLDKISEENWENKFIEENIINFIKAKEAKVGDYLWPMRVALTGRQASPGPFEVAGILGKKVSLKRITSGIERLVI